MLSQLTVPRGDGLLLRPLCCFWSMPSGRTAPQTVQTLKRFSSLFTYFIQRSTTTTHQTALGRLGTAELQW